jgi:murein DD-endopeptidase MepM/ murein hydrolase activator NlpD
MPFLIKLVSSVLSWLLAWFVGRKLLRSLLLLLLLVIGVGYIIPEQLSLPVARMRRNSYDQRSYWYYPWGKSVVHKGVDVFAPIGTPVTSATSGWVIFRGELPAGGQTVMVLGPKWRVHYYAHLSSFAIDRWAWIQLGDTVGKVGDTGNAKGRPPHLHYSIFTPIPYLWQADPKQYHWWLQPFFINPIPNLNAQLPNGPDRK